MYFKCIVIACFLGASAANVAAPRQVLQITVDGLRDDLLERCADNFSYLQNKGVVYSNAHFLHATPVETTERKVADINKYRWEKHCRVLFELPIAA